jgi:Ricin-type beta-trefoil lectin domain-like
VADYYAELRLPGLTIGARNISLKSRRRRRRDAGPFLIIARDCGWAFDTAFKREPDWAVNMWPAHGLSHQLWLLLPTGVKGEFMIVSVANGLALDCTMGSSDPHLTMRVQEPEPWQRWLIQPTPDRLAFFIQSRHNRRYLGFSPTHDLDSSVIQSPWFESESGGSNTQWVIAQPVSLLA